MVPDRLLTARLARAQVDGRAPSVVAGLVRGGELIWSGGRGEVPGPVTDVQYRIGSISKTFAAVLVMQLRDAGRVRLGEPVTAYLPECGLGPATVAQLLAHTTGLRSETAGPWWERTPGGGWDDLAPSLTRVGEPGRQFHYSNTGFGVVGELAARVGGAPWPELLRRHILAPLGLTRTTTRPEAPAAQGFATHPWADVLLPEPEHDHGAMAPAGQLWSTVGDLATFVAALAGDRDLLPAATLEEMRAPQGLADVRTGAWETAYGLGLQLWDHGGDRTYGHSGSMPGFLAMARTHERGDGAVLLANTTAGVDILGVTADLLALLDQHDPALPEPWRPTAVSDELLALTGVWYWGPTPVAVRAGAGGALEIVDVGRGGRTSRFAPDGPGRWRGRDGYYLGETLVAAPGRLELGSFVFTREPYEPDREVPGGDVPWGTTAIDRATPAGDATG